MLDKLLILVNEEVALFINHNDPVFGRLTHGPYLGKTFQVNHIWFTLDDIQEVEAMDGNIGISIAVCHHGKPHAPGQKIFCAQCAKEGADYEEFTEHSCPVCMHSRDRCVCG
jgi:hypothetical protein